MKYHISTVTGPNPSVLVIPHCHPETPQILPLKVVRLDSLLWRADALKKKLAHWEVNKYI